VSAGGEQALIAYRVARAEESLDEARLLLDAGHLNTAVNRLYYACFYAVSALLMSEGHGSAKHSGIRSLFDAHWVNPHVSPCICCARATARISWPCPRPSPRQAASLPAGSNLWASQDLGPFARPRDDPW